MNDKKILFVTLNNYPEGDAGAVRQHAMAKVFIENGYKVYVIGCGHENNKEFKDYDGVSYISLKPTGNIFKRKFESFMFASKVSQLIEKKFENNLSAIIVVNGLPNLFNRIRKYAIKKDIPIVYDAVEWYSPEEYKAGKFAIPYIINNSINKYIIRKPWKIIAISSYLENYFRKKGLETTRIPVIMECNNKTELNMKKEAQKKIFMYAGSPGTGKKDYLDLVFNAFAKLDEKYKNNYEFHIFGITEQQLIEKCLVDIDIIKKLENNLFLHGRVKRTEIQKWLKKAHYTVLIRKSEQRYAMAGFPTKSVESLMNGVPIVCNYSSDLNMYLFDKINSIIVEDTCVESIVKAIERAIILDQNQYNEMQSNAFDTFKNNFEPKRYSSKLLNLVKNNK